MKRAHVMAATGVGKEDRANARRDQERLDDDVKDYSRAVPEGAATFFEQAKAVDAIIARSPEGDLAGVGSLDSRLPAFLSSADDLEMQKNVGQMMLSYQKLVTGTGGGQEELKKIAEAGADMKNERSFVKGYESLKNNYQAYLRKVQGGYRPEVVKTFEDRVPEMRVPKRVPMPGGPLADAPATRAIKSYKVSPDKKRRVPVFADGTLGPEEAVP